MSTSPTTPTLEAAGAAVAEADGALIAADGVIEWVGATGDLTAALGGRDAAHEIDASGAVVMPGFVDCHTHIPFSKGSPFIPVKNDQCAPNRILPDHGSG